MLKFPVLEADKAYIGASLLLPKSRVAVGPIMADLTFEVGQGEEPRVLVRDHPNHVEVPRNFQTLESLRAWGVEVIDLRRKMFDHISLRPSEGFQFRPHQIAAWAEMLDFLSRREDFILRLDTGRGKTVMGLRLAAEVGGPVLVVSWQEAHLKGWEDDLRKHFLLDGEVGWILGQKLEWDREVVFSTIQTLARRNESGALPPGFGQRFALTIYDECHHQAAKWFCTGSEISSGMRMGLTATLRRKDRCEGIVTSQIGRVAYDDPAEDVLVPSVRVWDSRLDWPEDDPDIQDINGQFSVAKLRAKLGRDRERNNLLVQVIRQRVQEGHTVYAATHSKDHAHLLHGLLNQHGLLTGIITGDEKDAKERLRQLNHYDVVVVTVHVGKESYNRVDLSNVILCTPLPADNYAPVELVQLIGRALRPKKGKKGPVVDIINDSGVSRSRGMTMSVINWCTQRGWKVSGDPWNSRKRHLAKVVFQASR